MRSIALSALQAAEYINISERAFHSLRKRPAFPQPRAVGGRLRWLAAELDEYVRALPPAPPSAEPRQLRGTRKEQALSPTPEAWPVPGTVSASQEIADGHG